MKKNIILAAAAVTALLLSLSCTKQDGAQKVGETKIFTASIEQVQTKTSLYNQTYVKWDDNDQIMINSSRYNVIPNELSPNKAGFELIGPEEPEPPYVAYFPCEMGSTPQSLWLPPSQTYVPGQFNAPMVAISDNENLVFHNICGVLKLSLTTNGEEIVLSKITLSSKNHCLSGHFEISDLKNNDWAATILDDGKSGKKINVSFRPNVTISSKPTDIFIYLPAATYEMEDLSITFTKYNENNEELTVTRETVQEASVERNMVYPIEFNLNDSLRWGVGVAGDPSTRTITHRRGEIIR